MGDRLMHRRHLIDEASFEIPPGYQVMNMTQ